MGKKQPQRSRKTKEDIDGLMKEFGCNQRSAKGQQVVLESAQDFQRPEVNGFIQPLPDDPAEIEKLVALCTNAAEEPLKPGQSGCRLTLVLAAAR